MQILRTCIDEMSTSMRNVRIEYIERVVKEALANKVAGVLIVEKWDYPPFPEIQEGITEMHLMQPQLLIRNYSMTHADMKYVDKYEKIPPNVCLLLGGVGTLYDFRTRSKTGIVVHYLRNMISNVGEVVMRRKK